MEGAQPPLHPHDAVHELAHAEIGRGEEHAAKEQEHRAVSEKAVGFRVRAVGLPQEHEEAHRPNQPEQVPASLEKGLHRHTGVGVDLNESYPLVAAALGAAGEIVRENGLAAGALEFAFDPDVDDGRGGRVARDKALAAERRSGSHAVASCACRLRVCCMKAIRPMTAMPTA